MKKKILLGTMIAGLSLSMIGCASNVNGYNVEDNNISDVKSKYIEDIRGNNILTVEYIDKSTGVHYLIVQEYQDAISVTPMYNADGTIKTSEPIKDYNKLKETLDTKNGAIITATQYVDESTGVHYLIVQEYQSAISVTPMYNADGTIKTSKKNSSLQ